MDTKMMPPSLLYLSSLLSTQGPQEAADPALGQQDAFLTRDQASVAASHTCLSDHPSPTSPPESRGLPDRGPAYTPRHP